MIIALIPARAGSKRVPNKNIRQLDGLPLLAHSVVTAKQCPSIDRTFLSTDSPEYAKIGQSFGAEIINRSSMYSTDSSTDLDVIREGLSVLDFKFNIAPDLIVYLRPTTPVRSTGMIEVAIETMTAAGTGADSLRSVHEDPESVYKHFVKTPQGFLAPIIGTDMERTGDPNQQHVQTFKGNGYVDIVKPESIKKTGVLWGRCIALVTPVTYEIDTETDWNDFEWRMKLRKPSEVVFRHVDGS